MRRIDSFFVLILVLLSGLAITYKSAQYDLSGLKFQAIVNDELRHQIQVLTLKNKELELRYNQLLAQNNRPTSASRQTASSAEAEEVWIDPEQQAAKILDTVEEECKKKRSALCLQNVDSMVMQFPSSSWAGLSLVHLAHHYKENKKSYEADEVLYLVSQEFKKDKKVQSLKEKMLSAE